jgi:hypothetical protein
MPALEVGQGPMDPHLVLYEIRLGAQHIQLTRREERTSSRSVSVKITGGAQVDSGGL